MMGQESPYIWRLKSQFPVDFPTNPSDIGTVLMKVVTGLKRKQLGLSPRSGSVSICSLQSHVAAHCRCAPKSETYFSWAILMSFLRFVGHQLPRKSTVSSSFSNFFRPQMTLSRITCNSANEGPLLHSNYYFTGRFLPIGYKLQKL